MIFLSGVHGVGKSSVCRKIESDLEFTWFSASKIISDAKNIDMFSEKKVENIDYNQIVLIKEIEKIKQKNDEFILDGHFCLINSSNVIEKIDIDVFKQLDPNLIIVLIDDVKTIIRRLNERDNMNYSEDFITKFQNIEIQYAQEVGYILDKPVEIVDADNLKKILLII